VIPNDLGSWWLIFVAAVVDGMTIRGLTSSGHGTLENANIGHRGSIIPRRDAQSFGSINGFGFLGTGFDHTKGSYNYGVRGGGVRKENEHKKD